MRRLTLKDIAARAGDRSQAPTPVDGYAVDSRLVQPRQLFFALPGQKVDGHAYLEAVAAAGALGAVVSRAYQGPTFGLPLIAVDNVLAFLQALAHDVLAQKRPLVVGVTGSVGKTTTKDFLRTLLSQQYRVAVTPGNNNSQIGIPLAIINHTDGSEEVLVLEMGMSHAGEIATLVDIAPPDVAVITSVALVHAGNFDSLEAIARAKGEIFTSPNTTVGLLPCEVTGFDELVLLGSCRKRTYSTVDPAADYRLVEDAGGLYVLTAGQRHHLDGWSVPGLHNRHNLLAAIAVARELKVGWEQIAAAIPLLTLPDKRMQIVERHGVLFANDSYNGPPPGVKAALASLPHPAKGGRRIAVLGTMPELGKFSEGCHREIGEYALGLVDQMFCLGEECQPIYQTWVNAGRTVDWFLERDKLVVALHKALRPGDVVLIKGANSKQMWKILDELGDG